MRFHLHIAYTIDKLLAQEDTDRDNKITIEDKGPKRFVLTDEEGETYTIRGTYYLSNLLQELVWAKKSGETYAVIHRRQIEEPPIQRIHRMIRTYYWSGMTRSLDLHGLAKMARDEKTEVEGAMAAIRIYVPFADEKGFRFYSELKGNKEVKVEVVRLPQDVTPEYVRSINDKPGILSLALRESEEGITGMPFTVPGGRFNEMYGWDSYFQNCGLLLDGEFDLAKSVIHNFQYEIEQYGRILNANRSYYLTRSQPPFFTSMIREYVAADPNTESVEVKSWVQTAVKEYFTVWQVREKRLLDIGLNRYLAEGLGVPPEVEPGHYAAIFAPYAEKFNLDIAEFEKQYSQGKLKIPELDTYFMHDRTVRESGHDTSYRFDGICANLCPVELNCMLLKYEQDFAHFSLEYFPEGIPYKADLFDADFWERRVKQRKSLMNTYMWDEEAGMYYDYDFTKDEKTNFLSATCFFPLWVGSPTPEQAEQMVKKHLPKLTEKGGIAATTEASRGPISDKRPERQWDYPNGWAPHQMIIWKGLERYGFDAELQDLAGRWLQMIAENAAAYNGTIPEKFDVVSASHKVFAEYGNVGTQFDYITEEGFGWMNASFQVAKKLLNPTTIEQINKHIIQSISQDDKKN